MIIILVTRSKGLSQNLKNDSVTSIPNYQLRIALKKIDSLTLVKKQLELSYNNNALLNERISGKDKVISGHENVVNLYRQQISLVTTNAGIAIAETNRKADEKVRKHKRRNNWATIKGIFIGAVIGGAAVLMR